MLYFDVLHEMERKHYMLIFLWTLTSVIGLYMYVCMKTYKKNITFEIINFIISKQFSRFKPFLLLKHCFQIRKIYVIDSIKITYRLLNRSNCCFLSLFVVL